MKSKKVLWVAAAVLAAIVGFLIFKPAPPSQPGAGSGPGSTIETSGKPMMVEFYTDTCGVCIEMRPVIEKVVKEYESTVEVRFYNVANDQEGIELANRFGVQAVPTFIFFDSKGEAVSMKVGSMPEEALRQELDALD